MSSQNPQVVIDEKKQTVTIVLPLLKPEPSKSGKSRVIATTRGNYKSPTEFDGKPVTVGVNVYVPER